MYYTDNPLADFARKDADDQRWLDSLPKCCECGEPIQDDFCFVINDEAVCEDCLNRNYKKAVSDIVE